jgi:hypothetical protein
VIRVAVTGSRNWRSRALVWRMLNDLLAIHGTVHVIEGACPTGADDHAHAWAETRQSEGHKVTWERFPARWSECAPDCQLSHRKARAGGGTYCPKAGFTRNEVMAGQDLDVCLAFFEPGEPNRGTRHCTRAMTRHEVRVVPSGAAASWL